MLDQAPHAELIRFHAAECHVPATLVAAICEVESAWQVHAMRFEPGFLERYVAPQPQRFGRRCSIDTERMQRATSWGLMQVMGQTARALGATQEFLSALTAPDLAVYFGCLYLGKQRERFLAAHGWTGVIAAYNAGSPRRAADGRLVNLPYVTKVRTAEQKFLGAQQGVAA